MDYPRVFGRFIFRFGLVFRTSAYIQWGHSSRSLGSVLMLNPGSAQFAQTDPNLDTQLKKYGAAMGQIKADPTLDQLIRFVERIYMGHPTGTLQIYNLFHLQETRAEDAINHFEQLVNENKIMLTESLVTKDELQKHPWMLIGWGIHSQASWHNLREAKKLWQQQIADSGIPAFGKHNGKGDYYHPCPQIQSKRDTMLNTLETIFETEVKPLIPFEELIQHRYTVMKWNGKSGLDAQYIIRDNTNRTQSLIAKGLNPVWFHLNLDSDPAVSQWISNQNRSIDELQQIFS